MGKFIDFLRQNPLCYDPRTRKIEYNMGRFLQETTVFDCTEVAQQIIEEKREMDGKGCSIKLTDKGQELGRTGAWEIGIIPPFWNCFFEYPGSAFKQTGDVPAAEWYGVHCFEHPKESSPDYAHAITMTVLLKNTVIPFASNETVAMFAMDNEGVVVRRIYERRLAPGEDPTLPSNKPFTSPIVVALVSMMMISHRFLKKTEIDPNEPLSRQQRRFHERKGTTPTPLARYHVLSINPETTQPRDGTGGKGGWNVAWHMVRSHLRHYKSGKVVTVRAHSKGNPMFGVVHKDYKVKTA
jgi:hypothetical protein